MELTSEFKFHATHSVKIGGKPEPFHGHTFKLQITVEGTPDDEGFVVDFIKFKELVKEKVIDRLDNRNLNEIFSQPTVENIGLWVFNELKELVRNFGCKLKEVRVFETDSDWISVREDDL